MHKKSRGGAPLGDGHPSHSTNLQSSTSSPTPFHEQRRRGTRGRSSQTPSSESRALRPQTRTRSGRHGHSQSPGEGARDQFANESRRNANLQILQRHGGSAARCLISQLRNTPRDRSGSNPGWAGTHVLIPSSICIGHTPRCLARAALPSTTKTQPSWGQRGGAFWGKPLIQGRGATGAKGGDTPQAHPGGTSRRSRRGPGEHSPTSVRRRTEQSC